MTPAQTQEFRPQKRNLEHGNSRNKRLRRYDGVPQTAQEPHPLHSSPATFPQRPLESRKSPVDLSKESDSTRVPHRPYWELTDRQRREEYARCQAKAPYIHPELFMLNSRDSFDEEAILAAKGIKTEKKPGDNKPSHHHHWFHRSHHTHWKPSTFAECYERFQQRCQSGGPQTEVAEPTTGSSKRKRIDTPQDTETPVSGIFKNTEALVTSLELPLDTDEDESWWEDYISTRNKTLDTLDEPESLFK
ncbi:hypothetical protein GGS26DRAFT_603806 [Hypomontagnella submonticulosa]|nr:hypothetical protein GGS26DRAFT_603806 [Hypomontagnella submonticulosa]